MEGQKPVLVETLKGRRKGTYPLSRSGPVKAENVEGAQAQGLYSADVPKMAFLDSVNTD